MTPHDAPTIHAAFQEHPDDEDHSGAAVWGAVFLVPGLIAWIALVASLIALGMAVAK
jgi:hypothetical protein